MHQHWRFVAFLLAIAAVMVEAVPPTRLDDPVEGQQLARELREVFPAREMTFRGVLRISGPRRQRREVPFTSMVTVKDDSWTSTYVATPFDGPRETLTIRRFTDRPTAYEYHRGDSVQRLTGAEATNHFAGSDFALADFGLEFFHWPHQRIVMREMRKGRGADVLESRPDQRAIYSRVLSWIDQDSRKEGQPGLLMAEAYDPNGRILKEFEVKGFKRVAGEWQLSEMELRNRQTQTSTRLQFQFDKN